MIDVPLEEASRFGILNTEADGHITEFEEKPKQPKSTKASMGVYVFNWDVLKKYLTEDDKNEKSAHDFGKNVIPAMLGDQKRLFAWEFNGYWKDVGTTESLWEANMDMLDPACHLYNDEDDLRIYARNYDSPPTFVADGAELADSIITKGCNIGGTVVRSVISSDCVIEPGAVVTDSVLQPGVTVQSGASVQYAIVGQSVLIESGAVVGLAAENGTRPEITVIPEKKKITNKPA